MFRSFLKILRYLVPNAISASRAAGLYYVPKLMEEDHWEDLLAYDNYALISGQLDGIAARKLKAASPFGRWWNVTADRLFVMGHIIGLHRRNVLSLYEAICLSAALFLPEYTIGKLYAPITDMTNGALWVLVATLVLIEINDNTDLPLEDLKWHVGAATATQVVALIRRTEPIQRLKSGIVGRNLREPVI